MANGNGNERIVDKLRKVLNLTNSPVEGEAQAAAETLQRLLTEYNLTMADLELAGKAKKSSVKREGHDLAKAAFAWKLDLAQVMAEHYYCYAMVDRNEKTVHFIGREENVESMKALYQWIIDQIRRIASDERRVWLAEHEGEHIDPLRWQLNFGLGVVSRLGKRFEELAKRRDSRETALVVSHKSEISDYMEKKFGRRIDGKKTQWEVKWEQERAEAAVAKQKLKETDLEAYYRAYPHERPLTPEETEKRRKEDLKYWMRESKRRGRSASRGHRITHEDLRREVQAEHALVAGRSAADKVNLEPHLKGDSKRDKGLLK